MMQSGPRSTLVEREPGGSGVKIKLTNRFPDPETYKGDGLEKKEE